MKPIHRSLAGLAIASISLPVLLSLLACLPTPIGDPEKSRIDPSLSGMWVMDDEGIVLIEPYDKRTWLVTLVATSLDDTCEQTGGDADEMSDEDNTIFYTALVGQIEAGCVAGKEVQLFKAWQVKLGGQWFMTWEPMGAHDGEHGFADDYWYGFRIDKVSANDFTLAIVDGSFEAIENLDDVQKLGDLEPPYDARLLRSARRAVERVITNNKDNPELYSDSDEPLVLRRVDADHFDLFEDVLEDVISND
jgi:hypothetical protein